MNDETKAKQIIKCGFNKAWIGFCENKKPCKEHENIKCGVCGNTANRECDYAGQFVCGFPLCDDCYGFNDKTQKSGAWGFMNHSHRRKNED